MNNLKQKHKLEGLSEVVLHGLEQSERKRPRGSAKLRWQIRHVPDKLMFLFL
jgi:hypothetical protein